MKKVRVLVGWLGLAAWVLGCGDSGLAAGPTADTARLQVRLAYAGVEGPAAKLAQADQVRVMLFHLHDLHGGGDQSGDQITGAGGTGDIRVRVSWTTDEDIDLFVFLPNGEQIYFGDKVSPGGYGELDIDDIPLLDHVSHAGPHAENFFVPAGQALAGAYQVQVISQGDIDEPTEVTAEIFDGNTTQNFLATVASGDFWDVFAFSRAGKLAAVRQEIDREYWSGRDPDDWSEWIGYAQTVRGLGGGPEKDVELQIVGDEARGTLRVRSGEKFILVGVFRQGGLTHIGETSILAYPGDISQASVALQPFEGG